jgi:hypothetical protein
VGRLDRWLARGATPDGAARQYLAPRRRDLRRDNRAGVRQWRTRTGGDHRRDHPGTVPSASAGFPGYGFFNGDVDDVRISNIVRYTSTFTPPSAAHPTDANTRALYRLDEGSGQTTADASGNGYNLTLGTTANADSADPAWVASTAPIAPPSPTATPTAVPPTSTPTATPVAAHQYADRHAGPAHQHAGLAVGDRRINCHAGPAHQYTDCHAGPAHQYTDRHTGAAHQHADRHAGPAVEQRAALRRGE